MSIGQSVAVVLLAATSLDIPTFLYTPTQVKRAVSNYGRGSKEQIQEAVRLTLGLLNPPEPLDASDACAVALCHLQNHHLSEIKAASSSQAHPMTRRKVYP